VQLLHTRTGAVDAAMRAKLIDLTVSGYWAMSRWACYDGSTWALIALDADCEPYAWSCVTFEELLDRRPVVGVYVREDARGVGVAIQLVRALIALHRERICAAGELMAAASLWPRYRQIAAEFGLTFAEYE